MATLSDFINRPEVVFSRRYSVWHLKFDERQVLYERHRHNVGNEDKWVKVEAITPQFAAQIDFEEVKEPVIVKTYVYAYLNTLDEHITFTHHDRTLIETHRKEKLDASWRCSDVKEVELEVK